MNQQRKNHFQARLTWGWGLGLFAFFVLIFSRASAFDSQKIETFTAGVFVGGSTSGGGPLRIQHAPLINISEITKQILILAESGEEIPPGAVPYNARLKPGSDFGPLPTRKVRMRVVYRFIDPSNSTLPVPSETELIEGPDPIAIALEIPRSAVTQPVLQYRIVAEQIQYQGTQLIVLTTTTLPATTSQEPDPYFNVGVQANAAEVMGVNGGRFALDDGNPADGQTSIEIPSGLLRGETTITIDELPLDSPLIPQGLTNPVVVYRFDAQPRANGLMRITMLYPDFEFPIGQDGVVDGTQIPERELSVAWWDGFRWRNLGRGEIIDATANSLNVPDNTVAINVGALNFMALVQAPALSAQDRRPLEKIVTPNGDGTNDVLNFSFGDRSDNTKIEIFDISGQRIRTLMSSVTLQWDGRNDSGETVESGVYIYQYTVDGTRVSGLVAVAK